MASSLHGFPGGQGLTNRCGPALCRASSAIARIDTAQTASAKYSPMWALNSCTERLTFHRHLRANLGGLKGIAHLLNLRARFVRRDGEDIGKLLQPIDRDPA